MEGGVENVEELEVADKRVAELFCVLYDACERSEKQPAHDEEHAFRQANARMPCWRASRVEELQSHGNFGNGPLYFLHRKQHHL